jgi:hypothetical protein
MPAYYQPSVTTIVERHNAKYDKCNAAWEAQAVTELCDLHDDVFDASPASMSEFVSKWRTIARFEAELGEPSGVEPHDVITQMLDELQAINGIAPA